jgi:hypothetical protein
MPTAPKYSRLEIERRWVVDDISCPQLDSVERRLIIDLYIENTDLRLRKVADADGSAIFKLGKKYPRLTAIEQPVTALYLSESEYLTLSRLPGRWIEKHRYVYLSGAIDRYTSAQSPTIFEVEFSSTIAATSYMAPPFAVREVTNDPLVSGFAAARGA